MWWQILHGLSGGRRIPMATAAALKPDQSCPEDSRFAVVTPRRFLPGVCSHERISGLEQNAKAVQICACMKINRFPYDPSESMSVDY